MKTRRIAHHMAIICLGLMAFTTNRTIAQEDRNSPSPLFGGKLKGIDWGNIDWEESPNGKNDPMAVAEAWLFSRAYFKDMASSLPVDAELESSDLQEDYSLAGYFLVQVHCSMPPESGVGEYERRTVGVYRFSPEQDVLKIRDPDTGEFVDVSSSRGIAIVDSRRPFRRARAAQRSSRSIDVTPNAAPAATMQKSVVYSVVVEGDFLNCIDTSSGVMVGKTYFVGPIAQGPNVNGNRCTVVTGDSTMGKRGTVYELPSFNVVSIFHVSP